MGWDETASLSFTARHEGGHADDARLVLEQLEGQRQRLEALFERIPTPVSVVLHDSPVQLALAQPYLPIARRLASPAARRYMAGWYARDEIHVLAPAELRRAAAGRDSLDALLLTPQRVYTMLVVGFNNPALPPPFRPGAMSRMLRRAWQPEGAAQHFAGQVPYLRPALARRMREGPLEFPPGSRDAGIAAGSLFDMLARERDDVACVRLAGHPLDAGSAAALESAFECPLAEIGERWRAHLERLASPRLVSRRP